MGVVCEIHLLEVNEGPDFVLTSLKSVGGRKSPSVLKRDSSLPRSRSRSGLLWDCQLLKQLQDVS